MSLIAKELAIKVLGAVAVGGTVIGGGIAVAGYSKEDPELKKLREEKGLDCRGNYCTLAEGKKLTVKHDDNTTRELTAIPKEGTEGKIRVHRLGGGGEKKFSFSIEGGDITPTWAAGSESGSGSSITKLEEFETYEIEEGTGDDKEKNYLVRKTKAGDKIKKLLGLGDCQFPTGGSGSDEECDLDLNKLKAINFEGKSGDPTIADSGTSAKLTISLVADNDKETDTTSIYHYPFDYRFELSGDKKVTIPVSSGEIVKKANDSVEFKIKVTNPTSPGPRTISLEKVWDVVRLADKLGFTKCDKGSKTCKFPSTINVYKSETESVKEASVTSHTDKTITFTEEGATDYNGGVKFSLKTQVDFTNGTKKGTITTIDAGDYEIKEQTAGANNNEKAWYLSKK